MVSIGSFEQTRKIVNDGFTISIISPIYSATLWIGHNASDMVQWYHIVAGYKPWYLITPDSISAVTKKQLCWYISDLMLYYYIDGLVASVLTFWRPKSKDWGSTPTKQGVTAFAQEFPYRKYPSVGCSLSVAFLLWGRGIGKFGHDRSGRVRKFSALFLARKGPSPVVLTVSNVF